MLSEILGLSEKQLLGFLLALTRISALIAVAPIFGNQTVPKQLRLFLALLLTVTMVPIIKVDRGVEILTMSAFFPLVFKELIVGLFLGFNTKLIFEGFQFAGRMISNQMGLSVAELIDPESGSQTSPIGNFFGMLTLVLFLNLNGHHMILAALYKSFELTPVGGKAWLALAAQKDMMMLFNSIFVIGVKLAAPAMVSLFLMEASMGIMARIVPQMNIFFVGQPLRLGVGMFIIAASLPLLYLFFQTVLSTWNRDILLLLNYF
jgi:flagellar biosynthetic protein FliR